LLAVVTLTVTASLMSRHSVLLYALPKASSRRLTINLCT